MYLSQEVTDKHRKKQTEDVSFSSVSTAPAGGLKVYVE